MKIEIKGKMVNFEGFKTNETYTKEIKEAINSLAQLCSTKHLDAKIDSKKIFDGIDKLLTLEQAKPSSLAFLNVIYTAKLKNAHPFLSELNKKMLQNLKYCIDTHNYLTDLKKDWENKPLDKLGGDFIKLTTYMDNFSGKEELLQFVFGSKDQFNAFVAKIWSKILIAWTNGVMTGEGSMRALRQFYKPDKNFISLKNNTTEIETLNSFNNFDDAYNILAQKCYCKSLVESYNKAKTDFETLKDEAPELSTKLVYLLKDITNVINVNKAGNEELFEPEENYLEFYSKVWLKLIIANLNLFEIKVYIGRPINTLTKAIHEKFLEYYTDEKLKIVFDSHKKETLLNILDSLRERVLNDDLNIDEIKLPKIVFPEEESIRVYLRNYNKLTPRYEPVMFK